MRLLERSERSYERALLLALPSDLGHAESLSREVKELVPEVELRVIALEDPSNYPALFERITRLAREVQRSLERWSVDVLLSAGSPEAQTVWVLLVQAGVLPARLLQVTTREPAIREVRFDIAAVSEKPPPETDVVQTKLPEVIRHVEAEAIKRAMEQYGSIVGTSRALGIQRNTLKKKLRALGLYRSNEKSP
jgi:DNA-binding NtrC family response regulator